MLFYIQTLQKFNSALAKYKRKVEEIELNELTEKKSKSIIINCNSLF